jgi:hypothetical protein
MRLPEIAWLNGMEHLVVEGMAAQEHEVLLIVGGFDVD